MVVRRLVPCENCVQSRAFWAVQQPGSRQGATAQAGTRQEFKTRENFMKSTIGKASTIALFLTIAILALPAYAVSNELVGSSESHSIEKFDSSGNWIKTFASTGPWIPVSIAASPVTDDVFVATYTQTILRYHRSGAPFGPAGSYWSTFSLGDPHGNPADSLLFDSSGNLYVATNFGTSGYTVEVFKFSASQLLRPSPVPSGSPIITTLGRGDQMAWDAFGDLCIGSFGSPDDVQCYNPDTGSLVFDYASEIEPLLIQPVGIAFGPKNNLTVSSLFTGQIWTETVEQMGPMTLLATGTIDPAEVGWLAVDSGGALYLPEWHNANARYGSCAYYSCTDYDFSSDVVYKIDPSTGTIVNFITTHVWGPYQMIFVSF